MAQHIGDREELYRALEKLPVAERRCLLAKYTHEPEPAACMAELRISSATFYRYAASGLDGLRRLLADP